VRRGLRGILEGEGACQVVAEASDGLTAAQLVEKHKPGVLVLDLNMPRLHGIEVLRQARASSPNTRVIVLSMHSDEPYVIEALRAGAMAYVLKGSESLEIINALREVMAGRRFLSATLSEWAINALVAKPVDNADPLNSLTQRERMVLQLAAEGQSNHEMAEKLFISPRTAETHRANLMRKLGIQSQTDLVRFAIRKGLIQP
jgi:DNA-binding NarL/FixJ family response regulator